MKLKPLCFKCCIYERKKYFTKKCDSYTVLETTRTLTIRCDGKMSSKNLKLWQKIYLGFRSSISHRLYSEKELKYPHIYYDELFEVVLHINI